MRVSILQFIESLNRKRKVQEGRIYLFLSDLLRLLLFSVELELAIKSMSPLEGRLLGSNGDRLHCSSL